MKKDEEMSQRIRKSYAPRGQRSQVRITFLLDAENYEHWAQQPNRGRYLNELIKKDRGQ